MVKRTLEEAAQRRETQRAERQARSSGRLAPPGSHFTRKLGNLVGYATRHPGSKRGASHRPSAARDNQLAQAAIWSQVTGRPLPPHARIRPDRVSNAVPMADARRLAGYGVREKFDGTLLLPTPGQLRRIRHKRNRAAGRKARS